MPRHADVTPDGLTNVEMTRTDLLGDTSNDRRMATAEEQLPAPGLEPKPTRQKNSSHTTALRNSFVYRLIFLGSYTVVRTHTDSAVPEQTN